MDFQDITTGDIVDYRLDRGIVALYVRQVGSTSIYADPVENWHNGMYNEFRIGETIALRSARTLRTLDDAEIVRRGLEVNRQRRGRPFYPTAAELDRLPGMYAPSTEADQGRVLIAAHYSGPVEVWAAGYSREAGLGQVWGYARPRGADRGRWGYLNLVELEQHDARVTHWRQGPGIISRDPAWTPGPARETIPGYQG